MLHSCVFQTAATDTVSSETLASLTTARKRHLLNKHVLAGLDPTFSAFLNDSESGAFSIFVNNNNQLNILDGSTGIALYSDAPIHECAAECASFLEAAPYFALHEAAGKTTDLVQSDVLLVFGLGLGYVLQDLIEQLAVKFLIVYEPRADLLNCASYALDWQRLLAIANAKGIYLGLQIGNAGTNLGEHLAEIATIEPNINRIYYYRHLAHPVSDEVIQYYCEQSGQGPRLLRTSQQFLGFERSADYVPVRTTAMLGNRRPEPYTQGDALFEKNKQALEKYFPALARAMADYQAHRWQLVSDTDGAPNLYQLIRHGMLYRQFYEDAAKISHRFFNSDISVNAQVKQLVPYKLRHYVHYKAVSKLQNIEKQCGEALPINPDLMSSIVIAGCCLSLPVDELIARKQLRNVFLFEPETDFFFASLFVVPWHKLLQQFDADGRQLYLNVGGQRSEYFDEMLRQFYRVGAYALAETSFWLNYTTPELNRTFTNLKQQLKSVLALGDYFDHAKYGLNQTLSNLAATALFMREATATAATTATPVFIVGNGPSLDQTVAQIRHYQSCAIVVSCGTALKPLLAYGIVPDYHVEIEQNATTFDHLQHTCEPEKLQQITLISFSSIHPATRALFRQALLVFKESEAPTIVFKQDAEVLLQQALSSISYAFPTAANMALSVMLRLGHQQIYLFGVDFGQADPRYHHSKKSIYYTKAGSESYDYGKFNPEHIRVRGNFREFVYTKSEFDLARKVCEMQLKDHRGRVEIYNCSDGAFIQGAIPLLPDNILLATACDKAAYWQAMTTQHFISTQRLTPLVAHFSQGLLAETDKAVILAWRDMLVSKAKSVEEAKDFLAMQWRHFEQVVTVNKVVFCLYYSSAGYFFSRFTALLNLSEVALPTAHKLQKFDTMLGIFSDFLTESVASIKEGEPEYCAAVLAFLKRVTF